MRDPIPAARRGLALQLGELTDEPLTIENPCSAARKKWQAISVDGASIPFAVLVSDAIRVEGLDNPACRVPVADNRQDAVALQRRSNLRRRRRRGERRLDLDQAIKDSDLAVDAFSMSDRAAEKSLTPPDGSAPAT